MRSTLAVLFSGLVFGVARAQEPPAERIEEWKASAGLSAVLSSGNSVNQTVGGQGLISYREDANKIQWQGAGNYGRAKDPATNVTSVNTKNWKTELRYDRFLSEPVSLFGLGHIGADRPAGFDLRYGFGAGVAHELWKVDPNFFKYELGFDYTREEQIGFPGDDIFSGRVFLQYKRQISEWATFGQDVEMLMNLESAEDVRLNTLSSLTMALTQKVAFQAGFGVRYDNVPVPGKKKTDTTTQVGLVVNFM